MIEAAILLGLAVLLIVAVALPILIIHVKNDRAIRRKLDRARALGVHEAPSLHPRIDEALCIGCEECVRGCPEQDVLVTYRHKAVVLEAVECVGHGICERVCPVRAIDLVIGTETRGVEIPRLTEHFETNVPGLFVVGELGGMGLIRNAVWQASQAVAHIASLPRGPAGRTELLIAGAGPAGLAAALSAEAARIPFRLIEQGEIGGSILHYPRRKLVMTHPVVLPGVGELPFREVEKEPLLAFWRKMIAERDLFIEENTRLEKVEKVNGGFVAHTSRGPMPSHYVLMALGRRGTPRTLGVPGEDSAKVLYRLLEPERFAGLKVVIVGGGSAAIEAALALAEQRGAGVTLCHRRAEFPGARAALIDKLLAAEAAGRLTILRNARITAVESLRVLLDVGGAAAERPIDFVIVLIGGTPPYEILKASGVDLETKFGTPLITRSA